MKTTIYFLVNNPICQLFFFSFLIILIYSFLERIPELIFLVFIIIPIAGYVFQKGEKNKFL
jgi:CHASE2 domain-containing sensor protein